MDATSSRNQSSPHSEMTHASLGRLLGPVCTFSISHDQERLANNPLQHKSDSSSRAVVHNGIAVRILKGRLGPACMLRILGLPGSYFLRRLARREGVNKLWASITGALVRGVMNTRIQERSFRSLGRVPSRKLTPNTTCLLSSQSHFEHVMKNCTGRQGEPVRALRDPHIVTIT